MMHCVHVEGICGRALAGPLLDPFLSSNAAAQRYSGGAETRLIFSVTTRLKHFCISPVVLAF
jgi:hypothetical protein